MCWRTRRALLAGIVALSGCKLVDQTTFDPQAGKRPATPKPPPAPPPPAPEAGPPALLSIRVPVTEAARADIVKAVASARARKPDVTFDVVEITPGSGAGLGTSAEAVARMIESAGVPATRVRLAARPVPEALREVRVYIH